MKRYLLLLVAFVAISCVEDSLDDMVVETDGFKLSLTASAPESSVDSKTQISENLSVTWHADDRIMVCFPVNFDLYNNTGRSIKGVSGVFVSTSEDNSPSAEFVNDSWGVDLNEIANGKEKYNAVGYAFYPSSVAFSHEVTNYNYGKDNSVSCSYMIPSEQNAVEGSFDKDINPAYAVVNKAELLAGTAAVGFRNLAALVRITLGENIDNVNAIRINTANNGAATVCGTMNLSVSKNNSEPAVTVSLQNTSDATPVVLKKKDGGNLQAGQTYYAVIAPGRTHVGLKLTFVHENGAEVEKTVKFSENWEVKASDCQIINVKNPIEFGEPTVLEVDSDMFEASYRSESKTFNVTANYDWTATVASLNSSWLKVSPASGSENGAFTITVEENTDLFNARSAQILLTSKEKSVTINVNQDNKKYYVVERLAQATSMTDGGTYVIGFKDTPGYYLHVASSGKLERGYVGSQEDGFTADFVSVLEVMDGYTVSSPYGSYPYAFMGTLKSAYNERYWDIFASSFNQESPVHPVAFCSNEAGVTDLYYPWGGYYMSYYEGDGNFYWNTEVYGPYQWYIYVVEAR